MKQSKLKLNLVLNVMRPTGFVIRNMFSPKYTRLANITLQLGRA
jgi:hypothetical protein